jgi:hypothetical protein
MIASSAPEKVQALTRYRGEGVTDVCLPLGRGILGGQLRPQRSRRRASCHRVMACAVKVEGPAPVGALIVERPSLVDTLMAMLSPDGCGELANSLPVLTVRVS